MAFTPKQERQGTAIGAEGHNSAVANEADMPSITLGGAESAAKSYSEQGHAVFDGNGLPSSASFSSEIGA